MVNYAVLGPWDYLDIFRAPDSAIATKVSTLIRTFGHAHTEVYTATEWDEYKELVRKLPSGERRAPVASRVTIMNVCKAVTLHGAVGCAIHTSHKIERWHSLAMVTLIDVKTASRKSCSGGRSC